jgi:hypothetical protein
MEKCMEKDKDYGIIPGCGKPSLWKAGAEKIRARFGIVIEDPITEDLSTEDERRFRVTIRATHGGILIGAHSAECSSSEDKYKWKKAVCNAEWDETPENMRREKWKAGYQGKDPYKVKQIRTKIADVSNTILAMAIKRGSVGVTLQVTAASDIFTLDIENLEDLINNGDDPDEKHQEPKPESEGKKEVAPEIKEMKSGFPGKCPHCGKEIKKGDNIIYRTSTKKACHPQCFWLFEGNKDLKNPADKANDAVDGGHTTKAEDIPL